MNNKNKYILKNVLHSCLMTGKEKKKVILLTLYDSVRVLVC